MTQPIRVLVVDDSAYGRKVLREVLSSAPDLEVVGIARDGLEALEKIAHLEPDVVTLDLIMPNLDGVGVLRAMPPASKARVLIVSTSAAESELGAEALQLGAVDLVRKPSALATQQLYSVKDELVSKVRLAGAARSVRGETARPPLAPAPRGGLARDLVVIGTSTGGPQAITRVLGSIPADFPVPIAVALHIPAGYTTALAERLDRECEIAVLEAADGLQLEPATALIAPGGQHLRIAREGSRLIARLGAPAAHAMFVPSVDQLFESASVACGARLLGVVLTGMGDDGLAGSRRIRGAGGLVIAETEETCVVYGMPRCIAEAGLASSRVPLERVGAEIVRLLGA